MPRKQQKRRSSRRANRPIQQTTTTTTRALVPKQPATQRTVRAARSRNRRRGLLRGMASLSEPGLAFLKCAFAAPDFSVDPGRGIPDLFEGRTVNVKDSSTFTVNFAEGKDTYIILAPIPGVAYLECVVPNDGTPQDFVSTDYPTAKSNFGDGDGATKGNYSAFRFASSAIGIYPTCNYMNYGGSISVWKADIRAGSSVFTTANLKLEKGSNGYINYASGKPSVSASTFKDVEAIQGSLAVRLFGMQGISKSAPRDSYSTSFINGCYTMATQRDNTFSWHESMRSNTYQNYQQASEPSADDKTQKRFRGNSYYFPAYCGSLETVVIKVSTPTGTKNNTALIKTWSCLECLVNSDSPIYQFSNLSPAPDLQALAIYHKIKNQLPVAVSCAENAKAWERVSQMIMNILRAGSYIPGPVGLMSGGLATATEALRMMTL